ncbi:MAG: hypothetical protein JXM70_06315 [Pirellulales bacterium]|nr:hypothetical protein [Pirellulales bacterium]
MSTKITQRIADFMEKILMNKKRIWLGAWLLLMAVGTVCEARADTAKSQQPGRQVKVAAIAIGCGGNHDAKLKLAIDHLEIAGKQKVDIACLPGERL